MIDDKKLMLTIKELDYKGDGVSFYNNLPVFIKGALPDEEVLIRIITSKKKYYIGELIEVLSKSKDRVTEKIVLGSLNMSHLSFDKQLKWQTDITKSTFKKVFKKEFKYGEIITDNNNLNYRNKVVFHVLEKDVLTLGLYSYKGQNLIETNDFIIANILANKVVKSLNEAHLKIDYKALKHILIKNNSKGELLVTLISYRKRFKGLDEILSVLLVNKNIKGITLNIKEDESNILGSKTINLYGENSIYEGLLPITTNSFYQVNFGVFKLVIDVIKNYLLGTNIIDAYGGIGAISFLATSKEHFVTLIDNNYENIRLAKLVKRENFKAVLGNAEDLINDLISDTLIVDPPRSGLGDKFSFSLNNKKLKRVIYLSCNLQTLVRDLKLLTNYEIIKIYPIKMFPETNSFETLVILNSIKE